MDHVHVHNDNYHILDIIAVMLYYHLKFLEIMWAYLPVSPPSIINLIFYLLLATYICWIDCMLNGAAFGKDSIVDDNGFTRSVS